MFFTHTHHYYHIHDLKISLQFIMKAVHFDSLIYDLDRKQQYDN